MADLALGLLRHGYLAIGLERERTGSGATFESRLLGRRAVVLAGTGGARAFYDETLVTRQRAMPPPLKSLLFGRDAVHGLDGGPHRVRKAMFLDLLDATRTDGLVADIGGRLAGAADEWAGREVRVFDELVRSYGSAVLEWSGCRPFPRESERLSGWFARVVDGFGGAGLAYATAWAARLATDRWLRMRLDHVRRGDGAAPEGSALEALATSDLPLAVAAVELHNLIRPTVAVAWPGTFAALHLASSPGWRERLATPVVGEDHVAFAHEVRRTTPFAPALAGRVLRDGQVAGVPLRRGDRVVLDVWGIDTDPQLWPRPTEFAPERFLGREPGPFEMVPQGGGSPEGHRCPGEPLTVRILAETVRALAGLPLRVDGGAPTRLTRIPTLPAHGLRATVLTPVAT